MTSSDVAGDPLLQSLTETIIEVSDADMSPIKGIRHFCEEFRVESKKMWYLAGPAFSVCLCHYSLKMITQMFAGQLGTVELAIVSVQNSAILDFSFAVLLGMGSALETLCGQAQGTGKLDMMGVYLQRSWVILTMAAVLMIPLHVFAGCFLRLMGIQRDVSVAAGKFSLYLMILIPQLFANAINFPIQKYLQAQSKVIVMALISVATLAIHTLFSWLVMLKLRWGLKGAAAVLNTSYWLLALAQLVYIFGVACGRAWAGFSCAALRNLWAFVRLSVASGVMLCLEIWYFMALVMFAGNLKNPTVSLDSLSICMNILGWALMVALGSNVVASVRVSNELGAGHPRAAKFSIAVVLVNSFVIGVILSLVLVIARKQYPAAFTNSQEVKDLVKELTPLLAVSILVSNIQPVLSVLQASF